MMSRWTGIFLIAAGVLLLLFSFNPTNIAWGNFSLFNTKEVDLQRSASATNIQNVLVDTESANVNVTHGRSDQIKVRLHGKVSSKYVNDVDLKVEPQGDTLRLEVYTPDGFDWGMHQFNVALTVELPEKLWKSVKVQTQSGNVTVKEIESKEIALQARSGNLAADHYKSDVLTFTTESGNVDLSEGKSAIQGETKSGNIQVELNELQQDTDLKAGSGNITVNVENEPESLAVDYRGNSGNGRIDWTRMTYEEKDEDGEIIKGSFGSGEVKLKVRTGSGNFTMGKG